MPKPTDDPAIRRFIRQSYAMATFTDLAAELRQRFGLELSPAAAAHLWRSIIRPRRGRASAYGRNFALMEFIADRADLMPAGKLQAMIEQTFGRQFTPSRSHLSRLIHQAREAARVEFEAERQDRAASEARR